MAINQYEDLIEKCNSLDLPIDSEMIIGLPGETSKTWQLGL